MANNWTIHRKIDLSKPSRDMAFDAGYLYRNDNQAHVWEVEVTRDGAAASLSGYSARGYFIRPDGSTIAVAGSVSGNTARVTLNNSCYAQRGVLKGALRLEKTGEVITISAMVARVDLASTENIVINTETEPDVTALLAELDEAIANAQEAASELSTAIEDKAVIYTGTQSLTDAQKATACGNIGAVALNQGVAQAGKALVVGNDGIVSLGEAGVPEAVSIALLQCFQHVAWADADGQTYYDALYAALYGEPVPEYTWRYTPADGLLSEQEYITKTSTDGYSGTESVVNDELVLVDQKTTSAGGTVNTSYRFSTAEKCSLKCQFKCASPFPYFSTTNPSTMGLRFQISNGVSGARVYIGALTNTNTLMVLWFDGNTVMHVVETNLLYADYHVIEMSIDGDRQNIKIDDVVIASNAALAVSATMNQGMIMQHTNVELMETHIKSIEFDDESVELYKLDSPRQFSGQSGDYIDTGVKLLDGDKDFTIVFDADEVNHDYTENDVYCIYGFAGTNNTGFLLRARYAYGVLYYTLGYGVNANPSNKYQSSVEFLNYTNPSQSNNHIRGVISHAAGSDTCIVALKADDTYASIGGYDGSYQYVHYDGGNLIIGARQNSSSTAPIELFDGVVNEFTIYNYAMSADEVATYMNK